MSATSEPLAGSDTAFRGEASVLIESEAHDGGGAWRARGMVRALLTDRATVIAALNATARLHTYSYAPLGTEPTAGEARL